MRRLRSRSSFGGCWQNGTSSGFETEADGETVGRTEATAHHLERPVVARLEGGSRRLWHIGPTRFGNTNDVAVSSVDPGRDVVNADRFDLA